MNSCRLLVLLVLSLGAYGADTRFSGTWQAKVKDSVVCTIEIRGGDKIEGSIHTCHIHTDADGNLLEPEASDDTPHPSPISNARIVANVLSFEIREEGEPEPMKFEMTLVKAGIADLEIKNAPVKIRPIRFALI